MEKATRVGCKSVNELADVWIDYAELAGRFGPTTWTKHWTLWPWHQSLLVSVMSITLMRYAA
jgi:hypothetical protein